MPKKAGNQKKGTVKETKPKKTNKYLGSNFKIFILSIEPRKYLIL